MTESKNFRNAVQASMLIISRFLTRGSQAVAFVVLARVLSPAGFGAYGIVTTAVFMAGQLGNLGMRQSSAVFVGKGELTSAEGTKLLILSSPVLAAGAIVCVLHFDADAIAALGPYAQIWIALAVASSVLVSLLQGIFLGVGDVKSFTFSDAGPRVTLTIVTVLLAALSQLTVKTAIAAFAVSFLIFVPLSIYWAGGVRRSTETKLRIVVPMIRNGLLFAISGFFVTLNTRIGLFIIQEKFSTNDAGAFFAGVRFTEVFLEIATVVGLLMFSNVVRSTEQSRALEDATNTSISLFWLFTVISIIVELVTEPLIHALLGSDYTSSITFVRVLALSLGPAGAVKILNGAMLGTGRPYVTIGVLIVGLLVNLAVCVGTINLAGALGMAYGLMLSQFLTFALYLVVLRRVFGVTIRLAPPREVLALVFDRTKEVVSMSRSKAAIALRKSREP